MKKLTITLLLFLSTASAGYAETVKVLTSIYPVHSIASAIMQGVSEPELIITGNQSEHTYSLTPSKAENIKNADVIFYISQHLEAGLHKAIATHAADRSYELINAHDLVTYTYRDTHEDHHGGDEDAHAHDHEHKHAGQDMHIWLDPQNMKLMAQYITDVLVVQDARNTEIYKANMAKLAALLDALDTTIKQTLKQIPDSGTLPYITYHDAYQYFERRYGLGTSRHVTQHPEHHINTRHASDLESSLKENTPKCVFSEPQFDDKLTKRLTDKTSARLLVVDHVGAGYPAGKDNYFQMMNALATTIASCL